MWRKGIERWRETDYKKDIYIQVKGTTKKKPHKVLNNNPSSNT